MIDICYGFPLDQQIEWFCVHEPIDYTAKSIIKIISDELVDMGISSYRDTGKHVIRTKTIKEKAKKLPRSVYPYV